MPFFMENALNCPLCNCQAAFLLTFRQAPYYLCNTCHGVFKDPAHFLSPQDEQARYQTHNNDVNDPGYQRFVSPIVEAVCKYFDPQKHKGLDFGAGTGPVATKLLREKGFEIALYDPFFHNFPETLKDTYDFIISCEVVEHFYFPKIEFQQLKNMLKPDGKLILMTELRLDGADFSKWYYKNDPTHVFFYHQKTFQFIQKQFAFESVQIGKRLIIFSV